ncbi:unnamed protein product [Leptidea sinapis]|uniref:Methyltransferase type 11 domain-containing protein n=1 Tax=Leptidea sinapis TaxID=189913 RepID=A0A5E4QD44_9NEOP|nr:unnamed protein product [Leptidea sinapis]
MFVLSESQTRLLLNRVHWDSSQPSAVVDVGAGDGEVSSRFAHLFSAKYATEISASMRKQFECVFMLNLLDRCSKPRVMLRQASSALREGGFLVLALVLPYKPYGTGFEEQASSFVKFMQEEMGYELAAWSKVPYLCEGDFAQAYYWLDDSVKGRAEVTGDLYYASPSMYRLYKIRSHLILKLLSAYSYNLKYTLKIYKLNSGFA